VSARRVADAAFVLDALKESAALPAPVEFARQLNAARRLRVGVATNFEADAAVADVLLLPTTTTTVPRAASASADAQAMSPRNTVFANYYGLPAMTVPCGFDSSGMPIGLQIVAGPWADLDVLSLGQHYERAAGWFEKHPARHVSTASGPTRTGGS
jgi:Asp-tRNA(Asn)/Glu-tRNA(Gln) amidotransferase A subunit family amidase